MGMKRCLALLGFAGLLPLWPQASEAWTVYTHNFTADLARSDVVDDGRITINGREYTVRPEVVAALRDWPAFYNAGVVGPDGFPDLTYGQAVIHPGSPAKTGEWLDYILASGWNAQSDPTFSAAERSQILAFAYGYVTHAAGDMWAHTLVNDISDPDHTEGVSPTWGEILTSVPKAAIFLRHLIAESYIGDATPGFDDNPERGAAPGGDVSDDSSPSFAFDAPHRFVYETLINPNAMTPVRATRGSYREARGPLIGFFLELRDDLQEFASDSPNPLEAAIGEFDDTVACLMDLECDCNFGVDVAGCSNSCCCVPLVGCLCNDVCDVGHDGLACPASFAGCGLVFLGDFASSALAAVEASALLVLDAYLQAWVEDIDAGLRDWNQLGLAATRGLFNPQTRRDLQNEECESQGSESSTLRAECEDGIGKFDVFFHEIDDPDGANFINDHLLSMIGLPDFVGDVREIIGEITDVFEDILTFALLPFNPLLEEIAELREFIGDFINDAIADLIGVDIEGLEEFAKSPSRFVCLDAKEFTLPDPLGTATVSLFGPGTHDRLDGIMGLDPSHHVEELGLPEGCGRLLESAETNPSVFSAMGNTVTMSKLAVLDGPEINQVLGDILGRTIATYATGQNIMIEGLDGQPWLRLIDGDHAWRENGRPVFPSRDVAKTGGTGMFPVWESCVLRPAFRSLFQDWENESDPTEPNFPDLDDVESADPTNDPNPPTSTVTHMGASFDNGVDRFVAADNVFNHTAHDSPVGMAFPDEELSLQHRVYVDPLDRGDFITTGQNATFSIAGPDGRYFIDVRAADHCHRFDGTPEPTMTSAFILDATPPVVTCLNPPFGLVFDTDDFSQVEYTVDDGLLGSGVASSSSTLDGFQVLPGVVPIDNHAVLDMYQLYPGTRTVSVSAADNLANSGQTACTFEVHATVASLMSNLNRAYTEGFILNQGVFKSLLRKLEGAGAARQRGQIEAELRVLAAFADELLAQRGKEVDLVTADRFIAFAQDLITRGG